MPIAMGKGIRRTAMKQPDLEGRREFTLQAVLAVLAGTTVTISGCGGGGGSQSPAGPSGGPPSMTGVVSANHMHSAVIAGADIVAGNAVNLSIQGQATHNHVVALTAAEIGSLRRGEQVAKLSTTGDTNQHTHTVTFRSAQDGGGNPYDGY
jgi:hypothetical protein